MLILQGESRNVQKLFETVAVQPTAWTCFNLDDFCKGLGVLIYLAHLV